ncbi:Uncharacterised protein [Vibrio cholerae]|nr:Uncharacterised protein [Vibrio cholerae]CSA78172.1 Uncharacterised protein [Vibrio cholerae]CSA82181.1 Uncharacterised protein [Vibrio cholerae]CSA84064.1 Uncharacterised protein [Vibrio cholerae]CSA87429.1 Uncharacterised protein [Vibrio cholerae]
MRKQSLKPVVVTAQPCEIINFVNHSKHLSIKQCVRLRLLAARLEFHQTSI